MELWQMDVVGGVLLDDGRELKAVTGIDDHSLYCVAAGLAERASTRPVCAVFAAALGRHGVPTQILTDNGKVFTGQYNSRPVEVLFDRICRETASNTSSPRPCHRSVKRDSTAPSPTAGPSNSSTHRSPP
jgi:transposase InsO family protein